MALVKCKECGHDVSTEAEKCPNCGVPSPQPKRKPKEQLGGEEMLLILFTILGILFGLGWLISQFDSKSDSKKQQTQQEVTTVQNDNAEQTTALTNPAQMPSPEPEYVEYMVNTKVLNVRAEPSLQAKIIGTLEVGIFVKAYKSMEEANPEWIRIEEPIQGYVYKSLLEKSAADPEATYNAGRTTHGKEATSEESLTYEPTEMQQGVAATLMQTKGVVDVMWTNETTLWVQVTPESIYPDDPKDVAALIADMGKTALDQTVCVYLFTESWWKGNKSAAKSCAYY